MFGAVRAVGMIASTGWTGLLIQVLTGAVVYCIGSIGYIYFFKKELFDMSVKEIKRKLKLTGGGYSFTFPCFEFQPFFNPVLLYRHQSVWEGL